ncbi:MAG: carboxypeptidase-like regulatory domain-containing protein, partial [Candidatus Aminicenantes bacterium]
TTPDIDFILEIGGIIKGKVLSPNGTPIEPYSCYVVAYDMKENYIRSDSIDDQGKFILGFLAKGRYKLFVRYHGRENSISGWYKNAKNFKSATPVRVNPPQAQNVKIKLKRGGIIKGTITGTNGFPITLGCEIRAYNERGGYVKSVRVDERGQFALHGLETGRYKLYAEVYDYPWEGSPQPASEWYNGKYSFQDAEIVKVTAPKTKSNVDFSLSQGGYINCIVMGPHHYPISFESSVYAYNSRGERVSSAYQANYDGRLAINGLPSGNYRVRAVYHGEEDYLSEFYDNKRYFEVAEDITVTAPGGVDNIVFDLDYAGILQGFLTDAKKRRVIVEQDNHITIYAFDAETGEFAGQTQNTFTSGYHIELLEGRYKLAALSFYYNWMIAADDFGVTYHPAGKSFYDSATKVSAAKPGSAKKLSSLALKKPKGSISGTFYYEPLGNPMTEGLYMVFVFDADGFLAGLSGYLDSNNPISGEYRVGGLRPGNYYLLAATASETCSISDISLEWYGGVEVPHSELYDYTPKMDIPAGATPVAVGTTDTSGINFYIKK